MKLLAASIIVFCMLVYKQTDARPIHDEEDPYRQPPGMPYWPFMSDDFWGYVEYFRDLGAYNRINEMARTFFAHHPLGNILGYDVPYHEH